MAVTVENCTSICINALQKTIKRIIDRDYPNATTDEMYNYTHEELKKFSVNDQRFDYLALNNYLGGFRWFFQCPKCEKRASKLFLPPETIKTREHKYLCKACHRLKNQSALSGQNNMYKKVTRPLKRMKEIEDKISKGHLRSDKVQEFLAEYDTLEKSLRDTPEFRLYAFKKAHNL